MTSADTYIIDTHLTLVASAKLELGLFGGDSEKMNVPGSVFVKRHRLQENIVVVVIHLLREINDLVYRSLDLECVRIHLLAYLAFETLPVEGSYILVLGIWWLLLLLCQHPVLQTLEMN